MTPMQKHKTEITIPRKIVQKLLHHAQLTPDQEVCGLVSSRDNIPFHSYPIKNVSLSPETLFSLDAQEQIQVMAQMRDNDEQLFAIYHSHPTAPAIPSNTDLEQASYPEALYLIISLSIKGILEIRGYFIEDAQFVEISLSLT